MNYIARNYLALIEFLNLTKNIFENICLPIKSNYEFDVVGIRTGEANLVSIKIICTENKRSTGAYEANIRASGGYVNRKEVKKSFQNTQCDYVFVWTPEDKYLIPSLDITQKKALILSEFQEYKITGVSVSGNTDRL